MTDSAVEVDVGAADLKMKMLNEVELEMIVGASIPPSPFAAPAARGRAG